MSSGKQYGLQLTKKSSMGLVQKHAAFGDDSDSGKSDGGGTDWKKRALKVPEKATVKRQTKIEMQRALEEDSTVYQYDEIYDKVLKSKHDKNVKEKDKKPKYIQKLMVAADKRKIENERRIERQVQKEREAEGEEFKDKETFVTAAYKKKLEEFAKLEKEEELEKMRDEMTDVTNHENMDEFYRHMYQVVVTGPKEQSPERKDERDSSKKDGRSSSRHSHSKSVIGSQENSPSKSAKDEKENYNSGKKSDSKKDNRQYRKRKESESSNDKNKDRDTDVGSSSSSSSSSDSDSGDEKSSHSETEDPKRIRAKEYCAPDEPTLIETIPLLEPSKPSPPVEPQRSIWEKRTVGPVFDAALKRYLQRKSARLAVVS